MRHHWVLGERLVPQLLCQCDPSLHNCGVPEIGPMLSGD